MKNVLTTLMAMMMLFVVMTVYVAPVDVFATTNNNSGGSLLDKIENKKGGDTELLKKADESALDLVQTVRRFGFIYAVIMLVFIGFGMIGSNAQKLVEMKGRVVNLFGGLLVALFAEDIVSFITSFGG